MAQGYIFTNIETIKFLSKTDGPDEHFSIP